MEIIVEGICGLIVGSIIVVIALRIYYLRNMKRMEQERNIDLMQQHIEYLTKDRDEWMNKYFELELNTIKKG